MRELRSGLGGSSERGRGILRALLGSDGIRVSTEGERGFRLEGTLWLEVETGTAREHEANGRFHFAPPVEALSSTLGALRRAGFEFWAGSERFLGFDDTEILTNLIRSGANVTAENEAGSRVDLRISGSGLRYDDLAADAVTFRLGDVEVRVGRLEKLLRSKELAGRPKHVAFLCLFTARLREEARED